MENQRTNRVVPVLVVLLVVASFLIGSLYTKVQFLEKGTTTANANNNNGAVAGANAPAAPEPDPATPVDIDIADAPMLGSKDAKVAIVEYTDFQCPFCEQLFTNTFPKIKADYIDTGKVRYFVRSFPLFQIHPQAQQSAEAAACAMEQGKYWEYHDALFKNQSALLTADLKKYATDLGLNVSQFNNCLDANKYTQRVKTEQAAGEKYGVRGTPASYIGTIKGNTVTGVQISGAVPYETFKTEIDKLL